MLTKSFYSYLFILFSFSLISANNSYSQDDSYLDSLDGKFALQFQIDDDFQLSNFQGTIFSGKYHFSNRDAIRLGLSITFDDAESETETSRPDTNLVNTSSRDLNRINIVINAHYLYSLFITGDIGFFLGLGPFLKYEYSKNKFFHNTLPSEYSRTETSKGYGVGADLIGGVEWLFHESMSLSAEYGLRFIYLSREVTDDREAYREKSDEDYYRISGSNVKFGLTVYF